MANPPNPPPISDYERLRAERIQRNNARLESLGLLDVTKKIKLSTTPKKKRTAAAVSPSPTRASRRVKRRVELYQPSFEDHPVKSEKKCEFIGVRVAKYFDDELFLGTVTVHDAGNDWFSIVYDDADKEEFTREELMDALVLYQREGMKMDKESSAKSKTASKTPKSKVRCEIPVGELSSPLSKKQKMIIDDKMEGDFLGKFEDYLSYVDVISESNRRNVLKQITKLVDGEGIRYDSKAYGWPEGCHFMKGVKIGPHDDILKLMDIGQQCEDEWGRDHGNGWLLSHPLKKLYQFQQYCLKEKIVHI
jgi:hypothetical protein